MIKFQFKAVGIHHPNQSSKVTQRSFINPYNVLRHLSLPKSQLETPVCQYKISIQIYNNK